MVIRGFRGVGKSVRFSNREKILETKGGALTKPYSMLY